MSITRILIVFIVIVLSAFGVIAQSEATLIVSPDGPYTTIEAALVDARDGDRIEVHGGVYGAPLEVKVSVSLIGIDYPTIDGKGEGSLVSLAAPNIVFKGFRVINTGFNISHEDTAIIIQDDNITVEDNIIENVLFGIYFADANNGLAKNNSVRGYPNANIAQRGDGMRVWFSNDVTLLGNDIYESRDTLIWYADGITIIDNHFHKNRYGLHFMYSSNATITNNTFEDNHVGTYLMYSKDLLMRENIFTNSHGPSGYGVALKEMDGVLVEDNLFSYNRAGLYIDNSPAAYDVENVFRGNVFAFNDIGIAAQPSTERNVFQGNSFLDNWLQVGTRGRGDLLSNTWSQNDLGNYWSDYAGYDADNNGIGDIAYRSEKLFESLLETHPSLQFFLFSPAAQAVDFAAAAFPSLRPNPKLIDNAPMTHYTIPDYFVSNETHISTELLGLSFVLALFGVSMLWIGKEVS